MEKYKIKETKYEKKAVYDNAMENRYELTYTFPSNKEKSILVIALNPATEDIQITDSTTNHILNNLLPMKFTTITICNVYSLICNKLKPTAVEDNSKNIQYIKEVLERNFNTILIAYGNNYQNNILVQKDKEEIDKILDEGKYNAVELVDDEDIYSRLHTIHPLFAGQRFSGRWRFRKYITSCMNVNRSDEIEKIKKGKKSDDKKVLDNKTNAKSA